MTPIFFFNKAKMSYCLFQINYYIKRQFHFFNQLILIFTKIETQLIFIFTKIRTQLILVFIKIQTQLILIFTILSKTNAIFDI